MDIELRWFKPARSLNYILQYRKDPGGEWYWGDWITVPYIREGHEEEDGRTNT